MDMNGSVIIPVWIPKGADILFKLTRKCIDSIRKYTDSEIIIIDNASEIHDKALKRMSDKYYRNDQNFGYAFAVNKGFNLASNNYIAVMNNDAKLTMDWMSMAIDAFQDDVGAVCAIGGELREINPPRWNGALWMTTKEIVQKVGSLDTAYEMGFFEDLDFIMRLRESGYKIMGVGSVHHHCSASWQWYKGKSVWEKNKDLFLERWGDKWEWPVWG